MIELYTIPAGVPDSIDRDRPVIIIDIFRASTSMSAALDAGAKELYFAGSIKEGEKLKSLLGQGVVMAGEREGYRIKGYDLGNSPREMSPEALSGKTVVFNSTNGTKLLRRFSEFDHVIVGSFVCLDAIVAHLRTYEKDPVVCCAGTVSRFSGEDTLAAGMIISRLVVNGKKTDDASDFARRLVENHPDEWREWAINSRHGQYLASIGLKDDLDFCTEVNRYNFVPIKDGERIVKLDLD
ncbi:MAG: 2-phosphosulfolactate phosphatase [candidate division Zixibacteria bacterium]|nr:2-phosphosulfolactate phosphatase [candidate division Zixibacteria bacterium]